MNILDIRKISCKKREVAVTAPLSLNDSAYAQSAKCEQFDFGNLCYLTRVKTLSF